MYSRAAITVRMGSMQEKAQPRTIILPSWGSVARLARIRPSAVNPPAAIH